MLHPRFRRIAGRHRRVRPLLLALVVLPVAVGVAGCGVGKDNETQKEHTVVKGGRLQIGSDYIEDIYITPVGNAVEPNPGTTLAGPTAQITPSDTATPTLPPEGAVDGYLVATVTNASNTVPSSITSVSIGTPTDGASPAAGAFTGEVAVAPSGASLSVAPNGQLRFADPADRSEGHSGPYLVISDASQPLVIGEIVPVSFTVAGSTQTFTVQAPITTSDYGQPPTEPPGVTPSASPSATAGRTHVATSPSAAPSVTSTAS